MAHPGDKGVRLTPPSLGVYDEYAIEWLYKPVYGARDMWDEAKIAGRLLDSHDGDPLYRYGIQQVRSTIDPTALTEDLGDDPVKAGNYGVSNLKYILSNLNGWITDDPEYTHRGDLYKQICNQYARYLNAALLQVGGVRQYQVRESSGHLPSEAVDAKAQKASLQWVIGQLRDASWIDDNSVTSHMALVAPASSRIASMVAKNLTSLIPANVTVSSKLAESGYGLRDYYSDLYNEIFATSLKGGRLSSAEKTLQREIIAVAAKPLIASRNKTSLSDDSDMDEVLEVGEAPEVGESTAPYRSAIDIATINETAGYNWQLVGKVLELAKSRRLSAPAEDRAHYELLYRTASAALE